MHVAFAPAFCIVMYDTKVALELTAISKHWSGVELQKIAIFGRVQVCVGVLTLGCNTPFFLTQLASNADNKRAKLHCVSATA